FLLNQNLSQLKKKKKMEDFEIIKVDSEKLQEIEEQLNQSKQSIEKLNKEVSYLQSTLNQQKITKRKIQKKYCDYEDTIASLKIQLSSQEKLKQEYLEQKQLVEKLIIEKLHLNRIIIQQKKQIDFLSQEKQKLDIENQIQKKYIKQLESQTLSQKQQLQSQNIIQESLKDTESNIILLKLQNYQQIQKLMNERIFMEDLLENMKNELHIKYMLIKKYNSIPKQNSFVQIVKPLISNNSIQTVQQSLISNNNYMKSIYQTLFSNNYFVLTFIQPLIKNFLIQKSSQLLNKTISFQNVWNCPLVTFNKSKSYEFLTNKQFLANKNTETHLKCITWKKLDQQKDTLKQEITQKRNQQDNNLQEVVIINGISQNNKPFNIIRHPKPIIQKKNECKGENLFRLTVSNDYVIVNDNIQKVNFISNQIESKKGFSNKQLLKQKKKEMQKKIKEEQKFKQYLINLQQQIINMQLRKIVLNYNDNKMIANY
ncbi:hypothetical protein IMG5_076650, partial [Ichthyophthirius multifiliis]